MYVYCVESYAHIACYSGCSHRGNHLVEPLYYGEVQLSIYIYICAYVMHVHNYTVYIISYIYIYFIYFYVVISYMNHVSYKLISSSSLNGWMDH